MSVLSPALPLNDLRLSAVLLDPARIDSVVLRQLVEEVRFEGSSAAHGRYDRVHNRHNRGR